MTVKFFEGAIVAELIFRGARTLKDRRAFLRSITDRLRNAGFSSARIGHAGDVRRAWVAAVCVTGKESLARELLRRAGDILESPEWELVASDQAISELGTDEAG